MQLQGIRVVDLSRILSGRSARCSSRTWAPRSSRSRTSARATRCGAKADAQRLFSLYFASFNRNKRSLTLDLRSAEGKDVLRKLIAHRRRDPRQLPPGRHGEDGLSRDELKRIKPDIISCHITGFGLDGPYATGPRSTSSRRR